MKNIILTIIDKYDYPFVEPFIKSLKKTGYADDLVIFTSNTVSKNTKKTLRDNGAIIVEYNSVYPFKSEYEGVFKNVVADLSISNYRFLFFLQYLLNNPNKFKNIMLTDIRDVIFQKHPFDNIAADSIYFFLEDAIQTFRYSELNYKWSLAANGKVIADTYIDEVVSCAGITIGAYALIVKYLEHMKTKLDFQKELPWAFDQGVHNGYVRYYKPAGMHVLNNDEPFVATLGAYQPYQLNGQGQVITKNKEIYAIVHQYDRFGDLLALIKQQYCGKPDDTKVKTGLL